MLRCSSSCNTNFHSTPSHVLKVFPVFYVSMGFWVLLFLIRDKKDKFQLVSFIVELKQASVSLSVSESLPVCVSVCGCVCLWCVSSLSPRR